MRPAAGLQAICRLLMRSICMEIARCAAVLGRRPGFPANGRERGRRLADNEMHLCLA